MGQDGAGERLLVGLEEVGRGDIALVGGKGANLGELTRAGFPVPNAVCVTTAAYARFVQAGDLWPEAARALEGLDVEDPDALAKAGEAIRKAFLARDLPTEVAAEVRAALARFEPDAHFAVRSSATAEDLPEASFAGQQDTYLNVVGEESILDAVRRCFASLWTDRAIAYRTRNHVAHESVRLAVVVQKLIPADAAGVLFTANPLTGRRDEVVVDASPGLGEAVVSGAVVPDHYVIRMAVGRGADPARDHAEIRERLPGAKSVAVLARPGGGTERVELSADSAAGLTLDDAEALALARLGRAVEGIFGAPQDVEWARQDGRLYLLQARPITTLFPLPPAGPDGDLRVYLCLSAAQGMLEPLTPLGVSYFQAASRAIIGGLRHGRRPEHSPLYELAGRLFADVTPVVRTESGRRVLLGALSWIDPVARGALAAVLEDPRFAPRPDTGNRLIARSALIVVRAAWPAPRRILANLLAPIDGRRRLEREGLPRLREVSAEVTRPGTTLERIDRVDQLIRHFGKTIIQYVIPMFIPGMAAWRLSEGLVGRWGLDAAELMAMRQGLPHNPTTEMDLALWQAAREIGHHAASREAVLGGDPTVLAEAYRGGTLPSVAADIFRRFLDAYGHRAIREIDVGVPRWDEDPSYLFGVVQGYLRQASGAPAPDARFAELAREAHRAEGRLVRAAFAQPRGAPKGWALRFLAFRLRNLLGFREAPKFHAMWVFREFRRLILGVGKDLATEGRLDAADDAFFLTLDELRALAMGELSRDARALVAERRREYAEELERRRIPRVVTSDGETVYGRPTTDGNALVGFGVSPGSARGKVRVVREPGRARLEPGRSSSLPPRTRPGRPSSSPPRDW